MSQDAQPAPVLKIEDRPVEGHGVVRVIAVDRPERLNALNSATLDALHAAFDAAAADQAVRVVVLTGSGPKAFVAGADIAEMSGLTPAEARDFSLRGTRMMRRVEKMPKPVIAMVNGFALGGGLELAMCCHLRIAAETAKVGQPEINLGLIPGFGGTQRLLRLAGRAATLELCLLGTPIDAARAAQLGIVNRVVPAAELQAETIKVAEQLAASAPLALRGMIDCINVGGECGLEEGLEYESAQFGLTFSTEDMREGTHAFLARRKPRFTGR
ncbi:enoyl-CoA hydratase/isomerase family protein [Lysobacter brunescens]|uniref:Enoyl-CoA hydratase/isomerase family protein n=1 Tax=Lysobacter brunescens TaxID=262323 RepID=A0ABW2YGN6_9GAMM